ncbi:hypothetical protein, conserved [Eimeria tenella]|uniref:Uncharacterized protein n=1 Tax=Eimeria tenella TaxID=5802 RepID=U6KT19_EIMTE|nr:hypothetical protein, conserved [Eimeria tenella]CDJ41111.1 hypothetical protein, conserved [Eimeria tenella]|eukprot:XP_013231861.1 hypothetical protein, conserved [Eimeria tenella]
MREVFSILLVAFALATNDHGYATAILDRNRSLHGVSGGSSDERFLQNATSAFGSSPLLGSRGFSLQGVVQPEGPALRRVTEPSSRFIPVAPLSGAFVQLGAEHEDAEQEEAEEKGESTASSGESQEEKSKTAPSDNEEAGSSHEGSAAANKKETVEKLPEEASSSVHETQGSHVSEEEHLHKIRSEAGPKKHAEGAEGTNVTEKETEHKPSEHAKTAESEGEKKHEARREQPFHPQGETMPKGHKEGEAEKAGKKAEEEEEEKKHIKQEAASEKEETSTHEETKKEAHGPGHHPHEVSPERAFDSLVNRIRPLLKATKGQELYSRLVTIIDLHEKAAEAEKELENEAKKETPKEEAQKKTAVPDIAVQEDLLLTQQLSNMWVLPFYEENKRETCLSGFEKLTHEASVTCADPECFKLETQAQQCSYMMIESIMRKEDLEAQTGLHKDKKKHNAKTGKDHMVLGFGGECRKPESLGSEILNMLQHPKHLAKKHALERSTGSGGTVPLQKHHLDLICDPEDKTEYPSCKTVYEALQHVKEPKPRALPELLVLTDIQDLKNTLGLYRIVFLFEGLVQFATPDGTKIDVYQHKLPAEEAEFLHKYRHKEISATIMMKGE